MSQIRKITNPPIKEAIIEFQFQPLVDFEKSDLLELYNLIKGNYIEYKFLEQMQFSFQIEQQLSKNIDTDNLHQIIGIIF